MSRLYNTESYPGGRTIIGFGANREAKRILSMYEIQFMNYDFALFSDNNPQLYNNILKPDVLHFDSFKSSIPILPVPKFTEYCRSNPTALIVITPRIFFDEIYEQLQSYSITNDILSTDEFCDLAFREFIDTIAKSNNQDLAFLYQSHLSPLRYHPSETDNYHAILEHLYKGGDLYSIVAPPKTGSRTIYYSLKNIDRVNVIHNHLFMINNDVKIGPYIKKLCNKYIIGVRDPIAQNISFLFQQSWGLFSYNPTVNNLDAQALFKELCVPAVMNPDQIENNSFDYLAFKKNELDVFIPSAYYWIQNYFEGPLKTFLGFDVYNLPFDKNKGYTVLDINNNQILIYQLEKLNTLQTVFSEFTKDYFFKFSNDNISNTKYYNTPYREFLSDISIPKDYFNTTYSGKFANHFYSEQDIKKFKKKWISHVHD